MIKANQNKFINKKSLDQNLFVALVSTTLSKNNIKRIL